MKCTLTLSIVSILFMLSCKSTTSQTKNEKSSIVATETYEVTVNGMTCTGCEQTIDNAVSKLEGVQSSVSSHENGKVLVKYIPEVVDSNQIKEAINHTGYSAVNIRAIN